MSDLPDDFDCTLTNWEYIYGLCRNVSNAVKRADFEPDVVVALARGGWFAGRCICDFLGLNDLTSLKMEHYVGAAEKSDEPQIRYPMPEGSVEGKDVLIIDDIADTGGSIRRAEEYVDDRDAGEVRTATLQLLGTSEFQPDFVGEQLEQWTWVVYPWNFLEDMIDLTEGAMERADQTVFLTGRTFGTTSTSSTASAASRWRSPRPAASTRCSTRWSAATWPTAPARTPGRSPSSAPR